MEFNTPFDPIVSKGDLQEYRRTLKLQTFINSWVFMFLIRGVARIFLKGVLSLVSLARPFLQLVRCIVLASLATLNKEVEFKIPTTRTRNDCLFCCALLRGTARWSLLGVCVEF